MLEPYRARLILKHNRSKIDVLKPIGKSIIFHAGIFFLLLLRALVRAIIKSWKWVDKPHTIRIRKKTIIIGCILALVLYSIWPEQGKIVYAGGGSEGPSPVPILVTPKKIATLPQSHFEAVSEAVPIEVAPSPSQASNSQSSTVNLGNSVVPGCGDNSYANFIYMHESGCNLNAVNAGGCRGIGQACPGSKLPCGADYACQNAWFTNYANATYGGWAGAYNFWIAHSWW